MSPSFLAPFALTSSTSGINIWEWHVYISVLLFLLQTPGGCPLRGELAVVQAKAPRRGTIFSLTCRSITRWVLIATGAHEGGESTKENAATRNGAQPSLSLHAPPPSISLAPNSSRP